VGNPITSSRRKCRYQPSGNDVRRWRRRRARPSSLPGGDRAGRGQRASGRQALTGTQSTSVAGGVDRVQNNEWGSSEPESVTTDGQADFTVANSKISNATDGAPGGYPSIYSGCHWAAAPVAGWQPTRST